MELKNVKVKFGDAELMAKVARLNLSLGKASATIRSVSPSVAQAAMALRKGFRGSVQARYTGKRSYIDCYILRLAPQTVYSHESLFIMKMYIEILYPEYSYESVIKQCLLLRKLTRTEWEGSHEYNSNGRACTSGKGRSLHLR